MVSVIKGWSSSIHSKSNINSQLKQISACVWLVQTLIDFAFLYGGVCVLVFFNSFHADAKKARKGEERQSQRSLFPSDLSFPLSEEHFRLFSLACHSSGEVVVHHLGVPPRFLLLNSAHFVTLGDSEACAPPRENGANIQIQTAWNR